MHWKLLSNLSQKVGYSDVTSLKVSFILISCLLDVQFSPFGTKVYKELDYKGALFIVDDSHLSKNIGSADSIRNCIAFESFSLSFS